MLLRLSKKALIHFSESSLLLAIRLMFVAMGFVLTITFTHFLGAEGFGRYAYLLSWYEICIIIGIGGLDSLLVRQISRYKEEKNWNRIHFLKSWSYRRIFISSIAVTLIVACFVFIADENYSDFSLLVIVIWGGVLMSIQRSFLHGLGSVVFARFIETILLPAIWLLSFIALVFWTGNPTLKYLLMAWIFSLFIVCMILIRKNYVVISDMGEHNEPSSHFPTKQWNRTSIFIAIASFIYMLSNRTDIFFINHYLGDRLTGIYKIASIFSVFILFSFQATNLKLAPLIASAYATNAFDKIENLVKSETKSAFLYWGVPITVVFIFGGQWILSLFGKEYEIGWVPLVILCLGNLANIIVGPTQTLLQMTAYEHLVFFSVSIGLLLSIISNVILVPQYGLLGGAIASSLTQFTWNLLTLWFVLNKLKINPLFFMRT